MIYNLKEFLTDALKAAVSGGWFYHSWMFFLTIMMGFGAYAYSIQLTEGLHVTGMNDIVSWGIYISNFTFLVGMAAAAVMLVLPTYILKDMDFKKAVLIGEGVAVSALIMCLCFVTVDMGGPHRIWHMLPFFGYFNWPQSMLTWDVIVLNGYLMLNALIPFYILYKTYINKTPDKRKYVPFVVLSVFWAVGIHLVTAFLYAGLPARPFWNNALLGPRFLASAFAAGPAFIFIVLGIIRNTMNYSIKDETLNKLSIIITVAAQVNLLMLGSELFKEFYHPTEHSASAMYLFFGLEGHNALTPWIWTSIILNIICTVLMTINPLRRKIPLMYALAGILFIAVWIEKGMCLIVPGMVPSPLGEVTDYSATWIELVISGAIWALGFFILTVLIKVAVPIENGTRRLKEK